MVAFESLEDAAENSSFCSNNSVVISLLQRAVKSTPVKNRPAWLRTESITSVIHRQEQNQLHDENNAIENNDVGFLSSYNDRINKLSKGLENHQEVNQFGTEHDVYRHVTFSDQVNIRERTLEDSCLFHDAQDSLPTRLLMPSDQDSEDSCSTITESSDSDHKNIHQYLDHYEKQEKLPLKNSVEIDNYVIKSPKPGKKCQNKPTQKNKINSEQVIFCSEEHSQINILSKNASNCDETKLLHGRIIELEKEITTFRKENERLRQTRQQVDDEKASLLKSKANFAKWKETEETKFKDQLLEEKKKLAKEKQAFERFRKDSQNNRACKEEVSTLKENIESLKKTASEKETRWSALQGRLRDRISCLERDNTALKNQISILEKDKILHLKKIKMYESHKVPSLTKQIHEINKELTLKERKITMPDVEIEEITPIRAIPESAILNDGLTNSNNDASKGSKKALRRHASDSGVPISSTKGKPRSHSTDNVKVSNLHRKAIATLRNERNKTSVDKRHERDSSPEKPCKEKSVKKSDPNLVSEHQNPDGSKEMVYKDGRIETLYPNGSVKTVSKGGKTSKTQYFNGDVKETLEDGSITYYYAETQTKHTTKNNGEEEIIFPSGQVEKRYTDGSIEINFPDKSQKKIYSDGSEKTTLQDGTIIHKASPQVKVIDFPNGEREVHTEEYKKREYPNGSVKIVYNDGRQESHYGDGSVRKKDTNGMLL